MYRGRCRCFINNIFRAKGQHVMRNRALSTLKKLMLPELQCKVSPIKCVLIYSLLAQIGFVSSMELYLGYTL